MQPACCTPSRLWPSEGIQKDKSTPCLLYILTPVLPHRHTIPYSSASGISVLFFARRGLRPETPLASTAPEIEELSDEPVELRERELTTLGLAESAPDAL